MCHCDRSANGNCSGTVRGRWPARCCSRPSPMVALRVPSGACCRTPVRATVRCRMLKWPCTANPVLLRADVSDDTAWASLRKATQAPTDQEVQANIDCESNRSFDGLAVEQMGPWLRRIPATPSRSLPIGSRSPTPNGRSWLSIYPMNPAVPFGSSRARCGPSRTTCRMQTWNTRSSRTTLILTGCFGAFENLTAGAVDPGPAAGGGGG